MIDVLSSLFSLSFGLVFVVGVMSWMYKRHAQDWQRLAAHYGGTRTGPQALKRFGQLVLYRDKAPARPYKGLFSIEIYHDGMALRPLPLMMPFHDPLFIPYKDIKGWSQTWYLDAKSLELQFAKAPDLRIIMPQSQVDWIMSASGRTLRLFDSKPPHGKWPWASHTAALISGLMGVSVIVVLALQHFGVLPVPGA